MFWEGMKDNHDFSPREQSFGIIPMRREEGAVVVLMVQHQKDHWGFPKGHQEEDETPRETAKRELKEETGLKILSWVSPTIFSESYQVERDGVAIQKEVHYFPAVVTGDVHLQTTELKRFRWLKLSELSSIATFNEMKHLCAQFVLWYLHNSKDVDSTKK